MLQQPALDVKQEATTVPGEAAQPATSGDDAMTGDHQWKRIGAASLADRARGILEVFCQLTVSVRFSGGNRGNLFPDPVPEARRGRVNSMLGSRR